LCEGTRIDKTQSDTEHDVETKVTKIVNDTKQLVVCSYPMRDLDRFQSFYLAAKATGRYLVIDLKQAYLLNLFNASPTVKNLYPSSTDPQIKIYMPRGSWSLIDKDLNYFSEKQLELDYLTWKREFLEYDNMVDFRDIAKHQKEFMFYCSDFNLQELIDVKPAEGSSYIRSSTEPFSEEMELNIVRIQNWYRHFGLISKEKDWHQIHVSGHGSGDQIKRIIDGSNAKLLIPIHTSTSEDENGKTVDNEDYHRKWHPNVHSVNQFDKYEM
jgi:ribonuclease J